MTVLMALTFIDQSYLDNRRCRYTTSFCSRNQENPWLQMHKNFIVHYAEVNNQIITTILNT